MSFVFAFLWGLVFGSFLGMLTSRLGRAPLAAGRSYCDNCKEKVAWYDNIPILSFLLLHGRCRACKKPISPRYPVIEGLTGLLFLGSFGATSFFEPSGVLKDYKSLLGEFFLPFFLTLLVLFLAIAIIDFERLIIPDELLLVTGLLIASATLALPSPLFFHHLLWGAVSFLSILLVYLVTKGRGMGFGDVKLAFVLGLFLGYPESLVSLFLAFLTGGIAGAILILLGKASFGKPVPFGPFLIFGALVSFFLGEAIFKWYVNLP